MNLDPNTTLTILNDDNEQSNITLKPVFVQFGRLQALLAVHSIFVFSSHSSSKLTVLCNSKTEINPLIIEKKQ